ncbi:MAG: DUF3450 domain-containing protein [Proteobacteria bacterium]|nr:DUF3450 domain-containing protein [Pseudomonadota bacterium]
MPKLPNKKLIVVASWLSLAGAGAMAHAAPQSAPQDILKATMQTQQSTQQAAARSQDQVDKVSDETQSLLSEYLTVTQQTDRLRVYNQQVEKLIRDQEEEKLSIRQQLQDVEVVEKEILPFLIRMVNNLEQFVELDMPFLVEERRNRVIDLQDMMDLSSVTVSEKYRRVMEAYQIETDYGREIEAYRGQLGEGETVRTVDFLKVGRVLLAYQTTDRQETGFWNKETNQWEQLPDSYRNPITNGLRIARKQAAPELMQLPVSAPERAK